MKHFTLLFIIGYLCTSYSFGGSAIARNLISDCDLVTGTCCGAADADGGSDAQSATEDNTEDGNDNTGSAAENECIMIQFGLGRTTSYSDRKSVALKVFALEATPAIFTPESLYLMMGYTFMRVGSPKLRNGTPQEVIITHPRGEPIFFRFKEGESLAIPDPGIHIDLNERLHMVDAEGWATLKDPAYYDLYPGDGSRYRFLATNITGERGKFISFMNARGRELTEEEYGLSVIRNDAGIRQVLTPSRLANVILNPNDKGYDLIIHSIEHRPDVDPATGLYITPTALPVQKMTIRQGAHDRIARVTLQKGDQPERLYIYEYVENDWILTNPNGIKKIKEQVFYNLKYPNTGRPTDKVYKCGSLTIKEQDSEGKLLSKTKSSFVWYFGRWTKISETKGDDESILHSSWTYYGPETLWSSGGATHPNWGKIATKRLEDGQRITYTYDSKGRVIKERKLSCGEETMTSYTPLIPEDRLSNNDLRPRCIYKTVNNVEVERTYYVYTSLQVIRERCATPGAEYGAAGNLRTIKTYYSTNDSNADNAGRLKSHRYEDGSIDSFTYQMTDEGRWIEMRTKLHEEAMTPVSGKTTRIVAILNTLGYVAEKRTEVWLDDAWVVIAKELNTFNGEGRLTQTENLAGQITTTTWNCCSKTATSYPDGTVVRYSYDVDMQLITESKSIALSATEESSVTTHFEYDTLGQVIATWQSGEDGNIVTPEQTTEYDLLGRIVAQTDTLGNKTTTAYSSNGNIITTTYPNGSTQITTYAHGHVNSISGTAVTSKTYSCGPNWKREASGERWSKTITNMVGQIIREERSGANGSILTTTYIYDTYGRTLSTATSGQPTTTYTYNTIGEQIATTQTIGETWRKQASSQGYEFIDSHIWQTQTNTVSCSDESILPLTQTTRTQVTGLTVEKIAHQKATDARGHLSESWTTFNPVTKERITYQKVPHATNIATTRSTYGQSLENTSLSGITTSSIYDGFGRMISRINGRGNATTQTYNTLGQLISSINVAGNVTTYGYDDYGQRTSVTNALGNVTTYEYDLRGNKTHEDGATYPVRYVYDTFGNQVSMTTYRDEEGEGAGDTTTWIYDEASGVLLQKRYVDGKGWAYTYTDERQRATRTDAHGVVTTYTYDDWGQLTSTTYSDNTPVITSTYDAMGNQKTTQDVVGTTMFTYDAYGTLTQEAITGQYTKTLTHHVDTYGRDAGYSIDASRQSTLSYDPVTSRMIGMNADGDFTWDYLANTNLKSKLTYPNDATAEWVYEPKRNVLTSVKNSLRLSDSVINPHVISQYDYTNDAIGRRTAMSKSGIMMSETDIINYGYNARNEVISADAVQDADYLFNYAFDGIGNRESGEGMTYATNALNQYTAIGSAFVPSYDVNGNQALVQTTTGTWTVAYNAENRPIRWTQDNIVITMTYDRMGRRISYQKMQGDTQVSHTKFLYKGFLCVQQLSADTPCNVLKAFIWDPTETTATRPLVFTEGEQTAFYMHDGNKNVTDVISSTSASSDVTQYDYAPFGAIMRTATATVSTSNSSPITHHSELRSANPFRFSSEYHDDDLGLVYYNYRHYNPTDGRWINRDPIEEQGGLNLYSFTSNKISYFDSLGLSEKPSWRCFLDPNDQISCTGHTTLCCDGKSYDPRKRCCINKKLYSRSPITSTGIKKCQQGNRGFRDYPTHAWLEGTLVPKGSIGFGPKNTVGLFGSSPGIVKTPEDYYAVQSDKVCEDVKLSVCKYDIPGFKKCIQERLSRYEDKETSEGISYRALSSNCIHWRDGIIDDCKNANRSNKR